MADKNTGVIDAPAAGEQPGVIAPAAEVDQSNKSAVGEPKGQQDAAEEAQQSIPKERFDVVNNAKNAAETEAAELRQQLAVSQAQQQILAGRQQGTPQPPVDPMAQIVDGISEYPTGDEVKQALGKMAGLIGNVAAEASFTAQCPDYNDLVGEPDNAGKYRPAFQKAIESNPQILHILRDTPPHQQKQAAYTYAKLAQTPTTPEQQAVVAGIHPNAAAKLAAAAIPDSPMTVGGGGSIGKVGRLQAMTDEEFQAEVDKHKQQSG